MQKGPKMVFPAEDQFVLQKGIFLKIIQNKPATERIILQPFLSFSLQMLVIFFFFLFCMKGSSKLHVSCYGFLMGLNQTLQVVVKVYHRIRFLIYLKLSPKISRYVLQFPSTIFRGVLSSESEHPNYFVHGPYEHFNVIYEMRKTHTPGTL